MMRYSIKDLEHLTGIKAHTIRVWEKRYNLIEPERTSTNIRYYNETDLKRFMNIALLNKLGHKISSLANISPQEINRLVIKETENHTSYYHIIESLVLPVVELDELKFNHILSNAVAQYGFEETILSIVFPLFERIGYLWQTGSITIVQEHFVSYLIQQNLILETANLHQPPKSAPKGLLFLPEHESHELTLLFIKYLIKKNGLNAIYLGRQVPLEDLLKILKKVEPDFILTYLTIVPPFDINKYLANISEIFERKPILVLGPQLNFLEIVHSEHIFPINTLDSLVGFINKYR